MERIIVDFISLRKDSAYEFIIPYTYLKDTCQPFVKTFNLSITYYLKNAYIYYRDHG